MAGLQPWENVSRFGGGGGGADGSGASASSSSLGRWGWRTREHSIPRKPVP